MVVIYQLTFNPNCNCRGSYDAVGCPALVNKGLTAATLNRFAILKMSTEASRLMRSPKRIFFATRRSSNTVHGVVPALRPRFPSRERSVPLKSAIHGSWKTPVGENLGLTPVPE